MEIQKLGVRPLAATSSRQIEASQACMRWRDAQREEGVVVVCNVKVCFVSNLARQAIYLSPANSGWNANGGDLQRDPHDLYDCESDTINKGPVVPHLPFQSLTYDCLYFVIGERNIVLPLAIIHGRVNKQRESIRSLINIRLYEQYFESLKLARLKLQ